MPTIAKVVLPHKIFVISLFQHKLMHQNKVHKVAKVHLGEQDFKVHREEQVHKELKVLKD